MDGRVDLSVDEKKAVYRMLDSLGEKREDLLNAALASKGAVSRAMIAERLGYQPKPPSTVPRLYPHDIAQLDQLVADGLLHTQRRVSEGENGGRGREVVYMVASVVRQVDDEIKREVEYERQQSEWARQAALKHEKRQAEEAAERARTERKAARVMQEQAAHQRWLLEHPQPLPASRPRQWLGMTAKQWAVLAVLALMLVSALIAVTILVSRTGVLG